MKDNYSVKKHNKKRFRARRFIFTLIFLSFIVAGIFLFSDEIFKFFKEESSVYAINAEDALVFNKSNPLNDLVNAEIKIEQEKEIEREYEAKKEEIQQIQEQIQEKLNRRKKDIEKYLYRADDNRKIAYLTFDDGPSKISTQRILSILDKYDIKATFFVLGRNCDYYPDVLKEIYAKGHAIGNHTYSHVYKDIYKDKNALFAEVKKADDTLKKYLGEDFNSKLFRFPGGAFGAYKNSLKVDLLKEMGYVSYNWNSLNGDAEGAIFSKEHLFKRFKETAGNKSKLIVLMHDTDAKYTTPDALVDIIEYLKFNGYEFEKLPDA